MSRPLQSISCPANNVLLRVTVPRRTGRRRKKGSQEPFALPERSAGDGDAGQCTARDLQRSLEDTVGRYQVVPVGMVNRTHVFRGEMSYRLLSLCASIDWRGMPDFVFSTAASPFTNRFREQILSFDCMSLPDLSISNHLSTKLNEQTTE